MQLIGESHKEIFCVNAAWKRRCYFSAEWHFWRICQIIFKFQSDEKKKVLRHFHLYTTGIGAGVVVTELNSELERVGLESRS